MCELGVSFLPSRKKLFSIDAEVRRRGGDGGVSPGRLQCDLHI